MKLRLFTILILASALIAAPALALGLQDARAGGQVGEKLDGYIAAIKPAPDVNALVTSVNSQRQAEYARISKQNGQPVAVVAKLAAAEIINKLPAGAYYQSADGGWKQR